MNILSSFCKSVHEHIYLISHCYFSKLDDASVDEVSQFSGYLLLPEFLHIPQQQGVFANISLIATRPVRTDGDIQAATVSLACGPNIYTGVVLTVFLRNTVSYLIVIQITLTFPINIIGTTMTECKESE